MLNFSPQLRPRRGYGVETRHRMGGTRSRALTREFLIREEIAHAKDAKARQECGAGPEAGRGRYGGHFGVETRRNKRGVRGESFCEKWGGGFGGRALFQ